MRTNRHQRSQAGTGGFALMALLIIILILGLVSYTFIQVISSHRISIADSADTLKALYLKEGALEIGQQYIANYWSTGTSIPLGKDQAIFTNQTLGEGVFSVWVTMTDVRVADFMISARINR